MKAIALTAFFAATLLCALGADKSFIPKWTHGISSTVFSGNQAQNPASRATCDPTVFTSCLLTFFGSIGLSSPNLPSDTEFEQQLSIHVLQNPPQGFKDTCSYVNILSKCAPSSDCFTPASMIRLGFPSGQQDAILVLSSLLSLQYICTTGYQTALNNWQCIGSTFGKTIYCTIDPNSNTCTQAVTELTCIAKYYDQQCNNDVGNMFCRASGNGAKIISEGICDSNAIDNACNKADSLNNNFLSIALALIIALAVTSLKHA